MKKVVLLVVLLGLCAGSCLVRCGTLDQSYRERELRYAMIGEWNSRQLIDDWDYVWLYDRNCKLSQWHPSVGY